MASRKAEKTARQSILDRLIDRDPRTGEVYPTLAESVTSLKAGLMRDLEWMLNTRRIPDPAPDAYPEVQRSVFHFGIPDITSVSVDSETARRRLAWHIEECIQLFEPRLTNVRVTLQETADPKALRVRYVIEAMLRMDPAPERVVFDTVLETASGRINVGGDGNA